MALKAFVAVLLLASTASATAADWYVSPRGTSMGAGTRDSPWDIESAVGGGQKIAPGDTIWLLAGTYRHPNRNSGNLGYVVRLTGEPDRPILIRAERGQRVSIDGGLAVAKPATYVWVWDLEILVSENLTRSRRFEESGSFPKSYDRPNGGLNIRSGAGCKFINLVIHNNANGIGYWAEATDGEIHGCIIYDNGWEAPDRGHGHAIYTQNEKGIKTISDCIMTGGYGYTMHAYGSSRAFVDNYLVEGNICYDAGPFLIGGGRPSRGIKVLRNYLFNVSMRIGYSAPHNEDCEVRDNVIVRGELAINNYRTVVNEGNVVVRKAGSNPKSLSDTIVGAAIRPNRYDPDRFHIAVFNPQPQRGQLELDLTDRLKAGERFRLLNPRDFFGAPVVQGKYDGKPIVVPIKGEFASFVLLKGR
jgi:hypothetical protein